MLALTAVSHIVFLPRISIFLFLHLSFPKSCCVVQPAFGNGFSLVTDENGFLAVQEPPLRLFFGHTIFYRFAVGGDSVTTWLTATTRQTKSNMKHILLEILPLAIPLYLPTEKVLQGIIKVSFAGIHNGCGFRTLTGRLGIGRRILRTV